MNDNRSMQESQIIEWKWSWQDEFLKWLCGYANVDGGTLYIGVNDDGYIVGLEDAKAELERIPNKILDILGIIASVQVYSGIQGENVRYGTNIPEKVANKLVNQYSCGTISTNTIPETDKRYRTLKKLEEENPVWVNEDGKLEYLVISVPAYPFAISCKGKYYKRSGSTTHELNGFELQNFLLERAGKTWDTIPVPGVKVSDLSKEALEVFRRKAIKRKRMTESQVDVSDEVLLDNMQLFENGMLTRAAIMMFHPNPEKYVTGAYIKIAYFAPAGAYGQNKVDDIIYDDTIHGPLMLQIDKAVDLLYTKFLKALISYEGLQRIETFMWPQEAFREVLLNEVNHKAYETGIPIQIRVYDDKIVIWNDGQWPEKIEVTKVYERHPSIPHNPKMSDVFYRSGEIESWGSGFDKIKLECDKENAPYPIINANPKGGVELECDGCDKYMKLMKYGRYYDTYEQNGSSGVELSVVKGLEYDLPDEEKKSIDRMMDILSRELTDKEKTRFLPIAEFLKTNKTISKQNVIDITGKGDTSAKNYLKKLVDLDVLIKEGDSVSTIYRRK